MSQSSQEDPSASTTSLAEDSMLHASAIRQPPKPWPRPCPTFPEPWTAAAPSAGAVHGAALREFQRDFDQTSGDDQAFAKALVRKLQVQGVISFRDADLLDQIGGHMHSDADAGSIARSIRRCYRSFADDEMASPVAITIASIALDAIETADDTDIQDKDPQAVFSKKQDKKGVAANDLAGALTGANIGSKGGIWGGIIGGLVGGLGASWLAKKDNEKGDKK